MFSQHLVFEPLNPEYIFILEILNLQLQIQAILYLLSSMSNSQRQAVTY